MVIEYKDGDDSPIYVTNERAKVSNWLPTNEDVLSTETYSWFNSSVIFKNNKELEVDTIEKKVPLNNEFKRVSKDFMIARPVRVFPKHSYQKFLIKWYCRCHALMHNACVDFLKNYLNGNIDGTSKNNLKLVDDPPELSIDDKFKRFKFVVCNKEKQTFIRDNKFVKQKKIEIQNILINRILTNSIKEINDIIGKVIPAKAKLKKDMKVFINKKAYTLESDKIDNNFYSKLKIFKYLTKNISNEMLREAVAKFFHGLKTILTCIGKKMYSFEKVRFRHIKETKNKQSFYLTGQCFKDSGILPTLLGEMKYSDLKKIQENNKTSVFVYNRTTDKYLIYIPELIKPRTHKVSIEKCGIDLGIRTFATIYSDKKVENHGISPEIKYDKYLDKISSLDKKIMDIREILPIRSNVKKNNFCNKILSEKIKRSNNKLKKLKKIKKKNNKINKKIIILEKTIEKSREMKNNKFCKEKKQLMVKKINKYEKSKLKSFNKLFNMTRDMHFKLSDIIVHNYGNVILGDLNTKKILSKDNNLDSGIKRVLQTLSPYMFKQRLIHMGRKNGSTIKLVSEFLTTKTCSSCGKVCCPGRSKTYKCEYCDIETDRDANAAKNILKVGC